MVQKEHKPELRRAGPGELAWINERYREIDFQPSGPEDLVVVTEQEGRALGLGRLVPQADGTAELGGIYVFKEARGGGLARAIVARLIEESGGRGLFCLPFAHLEALYASLGFAPVAAELAVPEALRLKYEWCKGHYAEPVLLLYRAGAEAAG